MTPHNTDRQARRRKSALLGAVSATAPRLAAAALLLWCRREAGGAVSVLLLALSLIDLGTIVPVWICFRTRLKEIEGGEEDAAAEY